MDELIAAAEMKELFHGTNDQTWAQLRHRGTGPTYIKVARKVYYRRADVQAWINNNVYVRTDRPAVTTPHQNTDRDRRA